MKLHVLPDAEDQTAETHARDSYGRWHFGSTGDQHHLHPLEGRGPL